MTIALRKKIGEFLGHRAIRNLPAQAGGIIGIKVVAAGVAFLVQIPLARIMGAAEYGVYALLMSWVLIAGVFMRAGMDAALVRFVAVYRAQKQYAHMRALLTGGLGTVALLNIAVCAMVMLVPALRESAMVKAGALLLVPAVMGVMLQGALRGLQRVMLPEVTEGLLRPLLMLMLFAGGFLAWLGAGAYAAAWANFAAGIITVLMLLYWLARNVPREVWQARADFSPWREWRALALPMMAMAGLQVVLYRTDIVMVGWMLDSHQAGIYAVAMRMAELAGFGILAVNGVVAPLFAQHHAAADREGLARLLRVSTALAAGVAVTVAAGLVVTGYFLTGLFGPGFTAAYGPLTVLAAGQVAHAAGAPAAVLLTMAGRQKAALAIFALSAVLNTATNATFITMWGIQGAAAATALTYVVYSFLMLRAVRAGGVA